MHWKAVALAAACFAAVPLARAEIKAWQGATPALVTTDLHGNRFELGNLRGRVVVLNYWATWCAPCREELPSLQRLREAMKGKPVEVLTINYGEFPVKISPFVAKESIALPILLDTQLDIAKEWKVGGLPMTFVIDAKGRVRYSTFGERDWTDRETIELIEKLLAEDSGAGR